MDTIRAVVVDDEPLVRSSLRTVLEDRDDVELVGEAGDGSRARGIIEDLSPDLVFLDIRMPELDGFEMLSSLDEERLPAVIFVTAYDEYALRAFDVHAVDYVLKPFDEERLDTALTRAKRRLESEDASELRRRLKDLLADLGGERPGPDRIRVRTGKRIRYVPVDEIRWLEATGNYVRLHLGDADHLIRSSLTDLVSRLEPRGFVRIHRSSAVNKGWVRELRPRPSGDADLTLKGGQELVVSRTYREAFERSMEASG